jgi:hypothetical protein
MRFWIYLHLKCPSSTSLPAGVPNLIHLTLWWDVQPELWILIASVQMEERLWGSQWCWKVSCSLQLITSESQWDPHFLHDYPPTPDVHIFQTVSFGLLFISHTESLQIDYAGQQHFLYLYQAQYRSKRALLSSVGIVTKRQMNSQRIRVRFPCRVRTGTWAHQASYLVGSGEYSLGTKRQNREADHSAPCSVEIRMSGSIPSLSHTPLYHGA